MSSLQAFADFWSGRSTREQLLALAVASLVAVLVVLLGIRGAWSTLDRLDREIDRLSSDLVNFNYQVARRQSVEDRFKAVANQHSSAWSESEIRDRLRQEIYRLANRVPPELDADGIPLSTNSNSGTLVSIPKLGQGRLNAGGEGFREYQITVQIPPAPVTDMLAFLERLQGSPQSLRLDRIDMRRDPAQNHVRADVDISRIIVDTATLPDFRPLEPASWTMEGCSAEKNGEGHLVLQAQEAGARAWLPITLPAGMTFDMDIQIHSRDPIRLSVAAGAISMTGDKGLVLDGTDPHQLIQLRFTAPSGTGQDTHVDGPFIVFENTNDTIQIERIAVIPVAAS